MSRTSIKTRVVAAFSNDAELKPLVDEYAAVYDALNGEVVAQKTGGPTTAHPWNEQWFMATSIEAERVEDLMDAYDSGASDPVLLKREIGEAIRASLAVQKRFLKRR